MEILSNIRVVNVDVSLWTGRRKLRANDINLQESELPPEEVASLGSKKIVCAEALAPFTKIKARINSTLSKSGVRFMGGYALPESKADEVLKEVDLICQEGENEKQLFLSNYEDEILSWRRKNPNYEAALVAGYVQKHVVERQIRFGYQSFKIEAPASGSINNGDSLVETVSSIGNSLLQEISDEANDVFERSLSGKDTVNRRVLSPIKTMREKLDGMSFTHPMAAPLVEMIDKTLEGLPPAGPLTGTALSAVNGLMLILCSPERMAKHGEAIIHGSIDEAEAEAEVQAEAEAEVQAEAEAEVQAEAEAEVQAEAEAEVQAEAEVVIEKVRARIEIDF